MPSVQTHTFKTTSDGVSLSLDIYLPTSITSITVSSPAVLYFHAGGLVSFNRKFISPHFVQACLMRGWPLISADYRLLPQANGQDLLDDATDAYKFMIRKLGEIAKSNNPSTKKFDPWDRKIIVAGSSAPASLAFIVAAHSKEIFPRVPAAVLSYYGVPTFTAPLFSSNHVFWERLEKPQISQFLEESVQIGETGAEDSFDIACLNDDYAPNLTYVKPVANQEAELGMDRGMLYDWFVQENLYPDLMGMVDNPSKTWAWLKDNSESPKIIMIHGNKDDDVPVELPTAAEKVFGKENARLVIVEGEKHNFDVGLYWDDKGLEMVRSAWNILDTVIKAGKFDN